MNRTVQFRGQTYVRQVHDGRWYQRASNGACLGHVGESVYCKLLDVLEAMYERQNADDKRPMRPVWARVARERGKDGSCEPVT